MTSFTIGVDFGTQSARAVVVDVVTGRIAGEAVVDYPLGVIDDVFPVTGEALPDAWALHDADDYLFALERAVRTAVADALIDRSDVVGIAVDATSCTVVPVAADNTPLSRLADFRDRPHAWTKLWKHHAAQPQANRISELASRRPGCDLAAYDGSVSSEWMFPKALEIFENDSAVFDAAVGFLDAGDWITSTLVGTSVRSAQAAGFKANHRGEAAGYPAAPFLNELAPGFDAVLDRLAGELHAPGSRVGGLSGAWAEVLGLDEGIAVAAGSMDAQVAMIATNAMAPGRMVVMMGTSVCNLLNAEDFRPVAGVAGAVRSSVAPGMWTYEAGQAGVGDMFAAFARNHVPNHYFAEADAEGIDVLELLTRRAAQLRPGQGRVLALDWWSGNRSPYADAHLSGALIGLTLATTAPEIYRALLEAAAYGQRSIIDSFEDAGLEVTDIVACGGLTLRSPLLMQLLADITGRAIRVSPLLQTAAFGAALHAAVAAGAFADVSDAAASLGDRAAMTYTPDPQSSAAYEASYQDYRRIQHFFGDEHPQLMHRLRHATSDAAETTSTR
ncbi:MAG: ribulokinase [Microbacterium sp.]